MASTEFFPTPSTLLEPKYHMQLGNFLKFRWKNSKLSVLPENWHTWYLGGADSKSTIRFLKFRAQNLFLDKFGPKSKNCPFALKIGTHSISRMIILIPTLVFWISKMDTQSMVQRMLILIPTLISSIFNPKSIFRQIWVKKSQNNYLYDYPQSLALLQFGHCLPYVAFMFCHVVVL